MPGPHRAEFAFDLQPRLTGERIELRPLEPDDFDALYAAARDPLIWEQHPERDRWRPDVFRRYFDGAIASGGAFAIVDRSTGRIVGSSRYCNLGPKEREVEIGWTFLERAHWGGVTNGELKSLMLEHAFRFVDRVVFVIGADNHRSRKAIEKIGGRFLRQMEAAGPDGATVRSVVYAIERPR